MNATRFFLIRHGESIWNAAGRWQGHGDPPLSDLGREQVRRLAQRLAGEGIEVVVASDLRRAVETAAALGAVVGVEPGSDARLRELDVGDWTGLSRAEIVARDSDALAAFESDDPDARADAGESRRELSQRVRAAVAEIAAAHAGRRIALVVHLGVVRSLLPGCELANAGFRAASHAELRAASEPAARRVRPAAY